MVLLPLQQKYLHVQKEHSACAWTSCSLHSIRTDTLVIMLRNVSFNVVERTIQAYWLTVTMMRTITMDCSSYPQIKLIWDEKNKLWFSTLVL